ncbi:ABC transporter substrate-binding protein [Telmatospirillum sp.]|uniref:ABC transporter substrate-binding protein n=1 Tax=Telmatospirillum sp. TaxID=2079197 RepID=UPI00284A9FDF|nr:ABC transporter substrate-binding protein [Telmatospirillum sp.]MDR3440525.1 ABC transporter substrate-binding protein [Telmatospirillum sp.]
MNHLTSNPPHSGDFSGRRSARGVLLLQDGAINVYAFLPCPLKVRFKQALESYMAGYNPTAHWPLYCPSILDGGHHSLDIEIESASSEADLPEVIVAVSPSILLSYPFKNRFLSLYQGVSAPSYLAAMPAFYRQVAEKNNLGFLGFGKWSVIRDFSVAPDLANPTCWADLLKDDYRGLLAIHGCDGKVGAQNLMMALEDRGGREAVTALARNVAVVAHFSQIIKGIGSQSASRMPFSILPNAAAVQIPSSKNAAILEFSDGPLSMPLLILVKKNRIAESQGALDFFWGETFRNDVLAKGDFETPDRMDWSRPQFHPDWGRLGQGDYRQRAEALSALFKKNSPAFLGAES